MSDRSGSHRDSGKGKGLMGFFSRKSRSSSSSQSGPTPNPHPEGSHHQQVESSGKSNIFSKAFGRTRMTARKSVPQNFERVTFRYPRELPTETSLTPEEEEEEEEEEDFERELFPSVNRTEVDAIPQNVEEEVDEEENMVNDVDEADAPPQAARGRRYSPYPHHNQHIREVSPDESEPMDSEGYIHVDVTNRANQRARSPYPRGQYPDYRRHPSSTYYHSSMFGANPHPYPTIAPGPYSTVYGSPPPAYLSQPYANPYSYPVIPPPLSPNDPYAQVPRYGSPTGYGYTNPVYPSPSDHRRDSMLEMLLHQSTTLVGMASDVMPPGGPSRRSREEPYRRQPQPQLRRTASARRNPARDPRRG